MQKLIIAEISLLAGGFVLLNHLLDRIGFADFVKTDQTVFNGKDLPDLGIGKHIALKIFDDLMNGNDVPILFVRLAS